MTSEELRQRGNAMVAEVVNRSNLPRCLKQARLISAIGVYKSALLVAKNRTETLSCSKNIGTVCVRILTIIESPHVQLKEFGAYSQNAVECFLQCLSVRGVKPEEWYDDIFVRLFNLVETIRQTVDELNYADRVAFLQDVTAKFNDTSVKLDLISRLHIMLARELFTSLLRDTDDRLTTQEMLSRLNDSRQALELARLYAEGKELLDKIEDLSSQLHYRQCTVESVNIRVVAEKLLLESLLTVESLDMDMVTTVIDMFKQAIILARETDMEAEAIACVRLAGVYRRILKNDIEAKRYYQQAIQLALSMNPTSETKSDWYQEATKAVRDYQERFQLNDAEEQQKRKAPILEQLKEEIKALDKAATGAKTLLKHIYSTHPPAAGKTMAPLSPMKKALQKAIAHYHPDLMANEPESKKVLFEEIVKRLNKFYQTIKLDD